MPSAAVIGAGPVGCLTALGLHQRGYKVTLYEIRPEDAFMGANLQTNARSINLAISTRGLTALSAVDDGLSNTILQSAVPMRARMIHCRPSTSEKGRRQQQEGDVEGHCSEKERVKLDSQLYSDSGQCIYSVSRNLLNRLLLDEVLKYKIDIRWSHKLLKADLGGGKRRKSSAVAGAGAGPSSAVLREDQVELIFDSHQAKGIRSVVHLLVGCDGHHSKVRGELSRATEMDYSERYIDNYYSELHIPATTDGDFALDPNDLHIWPRHDFMLIALANQDKTFTSTLFAPKRIYNTVLDQQDRLVKFFQDEFPDAVGLIGKERLVKDLMGRKPSSLATLECNPYHYQGKAIVLGDAAHAMVPFYGQGLNCGLEDVRIMLDLIDKHAHGFSEMPVSSAASISSESEWATHHVRVDSGADVGSRRGSQSQDDKAAAAVQGDRIMGALRQIAFDEYSSTRHADLVAISQLALENYHEMSSKVTSMAFLLRKRIDSLLIQHLPANWWSSLYTSVTFSNIGYHEAQQQEAKQKQLLNTVGLCCLTTLPLAGAMYGYRLAKSMGWMH